MSGPLGKCAHPLASEGGTVAGSPHQNQLLVAGGREEFFKEGAVDLGSQNCKYPLRCRSTL